MRPRLRPSSGHGTSSVRSLYRPGARAQVARGLSYMAFPPREGTPDKPGPGSQSHFNLAMCPVRLASDGRSEDHVDDHCSPSAQMEDGMFDQHMGQTARRVVTLAFAGAAALW